MVEPPLILDNEKGTILPLIEPPLILDNEKGTILPLIIIYQYLTV